MKLSSNNQSKLQALALELAKDLKTEVLPKIRTVS
jgi:hypothetical protein